jgi:hypothetical protein
MLTPLIAAAAMAALRRHRHRQRAAPPPHENRLKIDRSSTDLSEVFRAPVLSIAAVQLCRIEA